MRRETLEQFVTKLDGMIAAIDQALVLGTRTAKEREACELLKDARLKLIEALEREQRKKNDR